MTTMPRRQGKNLRSLRQLRYITADDHRTQASVHGMLDILYVKLFHYPDVQKLKEELPSGNKESFFISGSQKSKKCFFQRRKKRGKRKIDFFQMIEHPSFGVGKKSATKKFWKNLTSEAKDSLMGDMPGDVLRVLRKKVLLW
jgi:hypothetical protein